MRNSGFASHSGPFTSPGTPEYGMKSWSSERVPLPASSNRRHITAAALMPFNSGRALPSKWDDAERWITSPISGYDTSPKCQPKSKSGPLGAAGLAYTPLFSASTPAQERSFMRNSPLTAGVLVPDPGFPLHFGDGIAANSASWSTNVFVVSDLSSGTSEAGSPDEEHGNWKVEELLVPHRDAATQMSPGGSTCSSSKGQRSNANRSAPLPLSSTHRGVRNVQLDKGAPTTSKQSKGRALKKIMRNKKTEHLPNITSDSQKSKLQREEAKIAAWENLQKAKAEAAIRKLEMQLEKKRSASMDKITNKLKQAETKARAKRNLLTVGEPATSRKNFFGCKYLGICFAAPNAATRISS